MVWRHHHLRSQVGHRLFTCGMCLVQKATPRSVTEEEKLNFTYFSFVITTFLYNNSSHVGREQDCAQVLKWLLSTTSETVCCDRFLLGEKETLTFINKRLSAV